MWKFCSKKLNERAFGRFFSWGMLCAGFFPVHGRVFAQDFASNPYYVVDAQGRKITDVTVDFGYQFSQQLEFYSYPTSIRLVGPPAAKIVRGKTGECFIGSQKLRSDSVFVLLNGRSSLSVADALRSFDLQLQLFPSGLPQGRISCFNVQLVVD